MFASSDEAQTTKNLNNSPLGKTRTSGQPVILIVEDHDDTRELLRTLLEMWGCRVVQASNGLEAVEAAMRERPGLILMEGSLPLLDGLEATRRIRASRLSGEVKIVALNGWGSSSYEAAALAAGSDGCLLKPFDFDRLRGYLPPLFACAPAVMFDRGLMNIP